MTITLQTLFFPWFTSLENFKFKKVVVVTMTLQTLFFPWFTSLERISNLKESVGRPFFYIKHCHDNDITNPLFSLVH
jgi:hypothetical protein